MKPIILSLLMLFTTIVTKAQVDPQPKPVNLHTGQAGYEAADWKTWLLDNPQQITIVAAPTAAQSKAELKTIKQRIASIDDKKMAQIKYWDAGAPSYRWNQV